jgi:hypothetical protein
LGGDSNTVTHNCATVAGFGVTSACDGAFHANVVIAPNTPSYMGTRPTGTFQYIAAPAILGFPAGTCMVLIS